MTYNRTTIPRLVRQELHRGSTPERLALAVASGIVLGSFPVFGASTALCLAVGIFLGLNQPVLQAVNYLATPLQLALAVPLLRLGETLFGVPPAPLHPEGARRLMEAGLAPLWRAYGISVACGVAVWAALGLPAAYLLYRAAIPLIARTKPGTEDSYRDSSR